MSERMIPIAGEQKKRVVSLAHFMPFHGFSATAHGLLTRSIPLLVLLFRF